MHEFDFIQQPRKPAQKQQSKANPVSDWIEVETDYFDLSDPLAIETNRHGELTQAQVKMFQQASLPPVYQFMYLPIGVLAILWLWGIYAHWYPLVPIPFLAVVLIVPGIFSLSNFIYKRLLKKVIANGKIEQVPGEVVRIGRRLLARSGERRVKMVDAMYPLPLEGNYLFFILAGTNYLLSAQALDGSEPGVMDQQAGERLLVELSRTNRFNLNELATNRESRLSDRQRARLMLRLITLCLGGLLAGAAILLGVYFLVRWNLLSMPWWLWIFVILGIVLLLAIVLACGIQATQLMQDWREERVVQIDGKVKRLAYRANDSSPATYQYVYNDLSDGFSYKVNKAAYRALAPGLRYRIYHTPRAHRLMSLEPLESGVSQ